VLRQTFPTWELVLIDDGSSDETVTLSKDLASRDPRIRSAAGRHGGPAVARNDGLRLTDPASEYVVFLDSDDTWEPDALEKLVAALERRPDCVAAHGLARATDMDGRQYDDDDLAESMRRRRELGPDGAVELALTEPTSFAAMLVQNWVVTPGTCLIRRSALEAVGPLEPSTSPADDWDLNIRLARSGGFVLVDRVVLNWRRHPDSLANTSRRWRWANLAVRRRTVVAAENTPEQRRVALSLLRSDWRDAGAAAMTAVRSRDARAAAAEARFSVVALVTYWRARLLSR
jgi:glycosyltransferase involved in cell wall biosynthesis